MLKRAQLCRYVIYVSIYVDWAANSVVFTSRHAVMNVFRFLVQPLKRLCETAVTRRIDVDCAATMLRIADSRRAEALKIRCFEFIMKNFGKVIATPVSEHTNAVGLGCMCSADVRQGCLVSHTCSWLLVQYARMSTAMMGHWWPWGNGLRLMSRCFDFSYCVVGCLDKSNQRIARANEAAVCMGWLVLVVSNTECCTL